MNYAGITLRTPGFKVCFNCFKTDCKCCGSLLSINQWEVAKISNHSFEATFQLISVKNCTCKISFFSLKIFYKLNLHKA